MGRGDPAGPAEAAAAGRLATELGMAQVAARAARLSAAARND
jgi:hypothetical protein